MTETVQRRFATPREFFDRGRLVALTSVSLARGNSDPLCEDVSEFARFAGTTPLRTGATIAFISGDICSPGMASGSVTGVESARRQRRIELETLADTWEFNNSFSSRLSSALEDPILSAMAESGNDAISLALDRLASDAAPLWLIYLNSVVDPKPAAAAETYEEAIADWTRWGADVGLVG